MKRQKTFRGRLFTGSASFFEKKFEKYLVVSEKVRTFAPENQK